jgi:hypothetical protein
MLSRPPHTPNIIFTSITEVMDVPITNYVPFTIFVMYTSKCIAADHLKGVVLPKIYVSVSLAISALKLNRFGRFKHYFTSTFNGNYRNLIRFPMWHIVIALLTSKECVQNRILHTECDTINVSKAFILPCSPRVKWMGVLCLKML